MKLSNIDNVIIISLTINYQIKSKELKNKTKVTHNYFSFQEEKESLLPSSKS